MGAWSAWQPAVQHTYAPSVHRHTGFYGLASTDASGQPGAPFRDAKASLDQHQQDVADGTARNNSFTTVSEILIGATKDTPDAGNVNGNYTDEFRLTQVLATFIGTGHEGERFYDPSVFAGMTPGVDYDESMIDYEAPTSTITGWVDWTIEVGNFGPFTTSGQLQAYKWYDSTHATLPGFTVPTWRIQAFDAELVVNENDIAAVAWQPYGAGVPVGSFTPVINPTSIAEQNISGTATLTLSAVGPAPILSVVAYSDFQGPYAQPITNFSVAADYTTATAAEGNTSSAGSLILANLQFWGIGTGSRTVGGVTTQLTPRVVYQSPRWRYWRPNASSGRLHTVGGHFHSPGGAQIHMMQQSGLGPWLPIEDL